MIEDKIYYVMMKPGSGEKWFPFHLVRDDEMDAKDAYTQGDFWREHYAAKDGYRVMKFRMVPIE